ncbi:MAG: HAMP domain-containing histidine kinase [Bacteroides sp.]|nr:HAMP domain-containing histidine kinase [Bacteroides sp.]MCM1413060.1 HAMP domain-containing histidine kinase [Bacteroides sp.]MCM1471766.1 HAMP domain-containing histidine kinase [Bacteroides sp.]
MKKSILSALVALFSIAICSAQTDYDRYRSHLVDSLRSALATKTTPTDSVPILYDLLNFSTEQSLVKDGTQLLETSIRTRSVPTQLSSLRRLGALYITAPNGQDELKKMINYVASLPISDDQRMTLAYLNIQTNVLEDQNETDEQRRESIIKKIKNSVDISDKDPFDRLEYLFSICYYLQNDVHSELVEQMLKEIESRIQKLPSDTKPIQAQFYSLASRIYTVVGHSEAAKKASENLLRVMDEIEKELKKKGHNYIDFSMIRYIAYRRFLTNFDTLSDEDIDHYYNEMLKLADRNPDIRHDVEVNKRPVISYLMAKQRYGEALELLKQVINLPANQPYLKRLYPLMIEAARQTGDTGTLLQTSLDYNNYMEHSLERSALERSAEMQILDEVRNISSSNNDLMEQQRQNELNYHRNLLWVAFAAGLLLLMVIVVLLMLYRRSHRLALSAATVNDELKAERDALQQAQKELIVTRDHARKADQHKMEFINNMSHEIRTPLNALVECSHLVVDNIPESKTKYLKRYADIIDVSADMISNIVNDVLNIAELENTQVNINRHQESASKICLIAVQSMSKHCQPGVEMKFVPHSDDDVMINTDLTRVEQVLTNLLSNGAKFTEEGYVHLYYTVDPTESTITFVVEDTGIGVPPGKEDIIFERFEKLSNITSGMGLGLNISRMMAELLHGTIKVDTNYEGPGARFLFTIPL